jgi:hypothetical protein
MHAPARSASCVNQGGTAEPNPSLDWALCVGLATLLRRMLGLHSVAPCRRERDGTTEAI